NTVRITRRKRRLQLRHDDDDNDDDNDNDDDDDVWPQWVCMSVTVNDTAARRDDLVSSAVWRA
ncbi:hypothetical protein K0M31_011092, partial [Melipona bicolor]